jgi:uncharacterized protein with PIN domain
MSRIYLCPVCKRPLRKIRTEENAFFTEEVWNCSACRKNYYKRRNTWIGAQPILADEASQ